MIKFDEGFILIMVMLLLTILSVSAFVAIEQSQLSYKINHARLANINAQQVSENARLTAINKLTTLLKNNEFNLAYNLGSIGLSNSLKNNPLKDFTNIHSVASTSDVYLKELPAQMLKNGVSLNQHMAYSGLGMGLGSHGSFSVHYELRARGSAINHGRDVIFWTGSDYRFIP